MLIDLTVLVTAKITRNAQTNLDKASFGHLGTHFDVMNKRFPLECLERAGIVFDVSRISHRDIEAADFPLNLVERGMFVAFYTGYIERVPYGTRQYFSEHPQLSHELIRILLDKKVSIIGVDFAGVRRGKEHTPTDQICADGGVFIVENLCNLKKLLAGRTAGTFQANTYPMNFANMTGLPCRVVAKTDLTGIEE
ncbi:MAG: cyclase family protein [Peptococcaceae bacterium]